MEIKNKELTIVIKKLPTMSTKNFVKFIYSNPYHAFINKSVDYDYKNNTLTIEFANKKILNNFINEFFKFYGKNDLGYLIFHYGGKNPIKRNNIIKIDTTTEYKWGFDITEYPDLLDDDLIVYPNHTLFCSDIFLDADTNEAIKFHGTNVVNEQIFFDEDKSLFVLKSYNKKGWTKYDLGNAVYEITNFILYNDDYKNNYKNIYCPEIMINNNNLHISLNT